MSKSITQVEARRLRKENRALRILFDKERNSWGDVYSGVHVGSIVNANSNVVTALKTARKLNHAVLVHMDGEEIEFFALPFDEVPA